MPLPITVLLVDDSRASRMLCCSVIRSLRPELQLLEAGDGEAALALLTANVQEAIQQRAAGLGVRFFRKPIGEAVIGDILKLLD